MIKAKVITLESNTHTDWSDFVQYESSDPYDDFGWFHVTVGATDSEGGNDFQVCVATPRAVGRVKSSGSVPGILVDHFDSASVEDAIRTRVESIEAHSWEQIVERLRTFMRWEYEGMS